MPVTRRPARKTASAIAPVADSPAASASVTASVTACATATVEPLGRFRCALCGALAMAEADSHPRCPDCNIHLIQVTKPHSDN
jgi:DNA-directed RNA polymerase subunit RPC12/RpoP